MAFGANFKFEKHTGFIGLLVWLEIRKFAPSPPPTQGEFPNRHTSSVKQS